MGITPSFPYEKKDPKEQRICSIIDRIIKPWNSESLTLNDLVITPFKITDKKDGIQKFAFLPKSLYVHFVNMSIYQVTRYELSYIESIYNLANSNQSCTGAIRVMLYKENLYLNFRKDPKLYPMIAEAPQVEEHFIKPFFKKADLLHDNTCSFISLAVAFDIEEIHKAHANVVLILKNGDDIHFFLYEPHGSEGNKSEYKHHFSRMQTEFKQFLVNVFKSRGFNAQPISEVSISCPKGIQNFMDDKLGYCAPISSLWIYIVLIIMNESDDKQKLEFMYNLNIIEKCIYKSCQNNPEKVHNMIVNFTKHFIEHFYSRHMIDDCKAKPTHRPRLLATSIPKTNFERFITYFEERFNTLSDGYKKTRNIHLTKEGIEQCVI